MELTKSYEKALPSELKTKFVYAEVRDAAKVIAATCPNEWKEVCDHLKTFRLKTESLMIAGGNKSQVVEDLESLFYSNGWEECRLDSETTYYKANRVRGEKKFRIDPEKLSREERFKLRSTHPEMIVSEVFQPGYFIDALKNKLAIDIEWNAKDGNLDRDISAYRAWYEAGVINGAILITKDLNSCRALVNKIWEKYCENHPEVSGIETPVDLGTTTTTTLKKAIDRIARGDAGGCPILLIGVSDQCWDGKNIEGLSNENEIVAGAKKRHKQRNQTGK